MDIEALRGKLLFIAYALGILVVLSLIIVALSYVRYAFVLLAVSILLAYILIPYVNFFNKPIIVPVKEYVKIHRLVLKVPLRRKDLVLHRRGFSRIASILIVYAILLLLFLLTAFYIVPIVSLESRNLYENRITYYNTAAELYYRAIDWITPRIPRAIDDYIPELTSKIGEETRKFGISILQKTVSMATSLLSFLVMIIIVPLMTFSILLDIDKYRTLSMAIIPEKRKEEFRELLHEIDCILGRYIRGQVKVCIIIGASVTVALKFLGIPYAELIGIFSGIVEIIPYLGVIMGMIPAVLFALSKGPLYTLLVLAVLYFIHWLEGHTIVPNVVGHSVGLPPIVVFISLIIGAETLGLLGMFLAVPVASVIRVIINHYLKVFSKAAVRPTP